MLHLHRAARADALVDALARPARRPARRPVRARARSPSPRGAWSGGWRRRCPPGWAPRTGARDGVCANVAFPSPGRLVSEAVAAASGIDPDARPVAARPARLAAARGRRRGTRPSRGWRRSPPTSAPRRTRPALQHRAAPRRALRPLRPAPAGDGARVGRGGGREHWQAELWRRLRARHRGSPSPAERLETAVRAAPRRAGRWSTSPTALAVRPHAPAGRASSQVLRALAAAPRRPPLPPAPVARAVGERRRGSTRPVVPPPARRPHRRPAAATACSPPGARTRASCSSSSRAARRTSTTTTASPRRPRHAARAPPGRRPRRPRAPGRRCRATGRASARPRRPQPSQVHACHGRARQVEVLRDAILHLLADDPTLEPRDVIVMCPDIETFAPLIHATFGSGEVAVEDDEDDALRRRPPARPARAAGRPLAAPDQPGARRRRPAARPRGARLTASQVLDLADREPVRRRFRLDDDDLARARRTGWPPAASAGASTPRTARRSSSTRFHAGTWRAGLDRVLRRRHDDRGRQPPVRRRPAARRRRERRDRPRRPLRRARRPPRSRARRARPAPKPVDDWADGDRRRRRRPDRHRAARRLAARRARSASSTTSSTRRACGADRRRRSSRSREVRALLADRLQGRPTRANFRTGHLTICTLVPMRSVPHRVVCLLGLDDGVFPRQAPRDGDDLMLADPHVGDRDAAHRGPPAAARRAAGGDRPADRHLHRQRRAHERAARRRPCRSASCSTSSTRTVQVRRRARRATGSSSAIRCSRSTRATSPPARSRADRAVELRPRHPRRRARRSPARAPRRAVPGGPLPPARRRRWSSSTTSCASSSTRCARSCASGSAFGVGDYADEIEDAPAGRARRPRAVGRRPAAARRARSPASTRRRARHGRDRAAGRCRPGVLGQPVLERVCPTSRTIVGAAEALRRAGEPPRLGRRPRRAARRPPAQRHGARASRGDVLRDRHLLARRARATGSPPGCACSRSPPPTPSAASRPSTSAARRGRGAATRRAAPARRRCRRAGAELRSRTSTALVDLYDRGHARAAAALLPDLGRLRRGRRARGEDARPAADGPGSRGAASTGEDSEPEHQLVLGGVRLRRPARAAALRRAGDGWRRARPRASAATRAALGRPARPRGDRRARDDRRPHDRFDVCGPLPTGVTVLEASAGTGKTTRSPRSPPATSPRATPLDAAAARDLHPHGHRRAARARPRAAGRPPSRGSTARSPARRPDGDEVVALLADGAADEVALRRDRLRRALADFDAATIATTHGFCQEVLGGLGRRRRRRARRRVRRGRRATSLEEVVDDLYVRRFHAAATPAVRPRRGADDRRDRRSTTRPRRSSRADAPDRRSPAMRAPARARPCASELERRKRRLAVMTYDDLLTRLRRRRSRATNGAAAAARLRARYGVVLVDEFQDTDPVQWDIMRRAFGDGRRDARAHRRPEAGDLRLPRRRRLRLPRRGRRPPARAPRCRRTGAATRGCSTPTTRCSAAPSSATRASSTARCAPPRPTARRA